MEGIISKFIKLVRPLEQSEVRGSNEQHGELYRGVLFTRSAVNDTVIRL